MKGNFKFWIFMLLSLILAVFMGCDSGKETVEQITGKEAVKQFEKSKEKISDVVEKQTDRLNTIDEEDYDEELDDEFSEETEEE